MKNSKFRVTISKHTLPDGNFHIDIFFETDSENLITYEVISSSDILIEKIYDATAKTIFFGRQAENRPKFFEVNLQKLTFCRNAIYQCERKQDHRNIYLDYEGNITNDRGQLKILFKGFYIRKDCLGNQNISIKISGSNVILYN